ncbi:hypothetical protein ACG2LH_04025 [Zhouia sp. PK063]|uniref:hypothetical protein n=1 Tax=Zhouia sp. PK063 TaxID=3373602 RepID=UPI0037A3F5B8
MKKLLIAVCLCTGVSAFAQTNTSLLDHYKAFYKEMKAHGDVRGAIDALTHIDVLAPSQANKDTLAYYYANGRQYVQALNVLGTTKDTNASDLAVEVKAMALKAVNQPELAIEQYDILFQRKPDVYLAYDLVDLNLQTGKTAEAKTYINYGLANAKDDQMLPFYQSQPAYQVPIKAAFTYQLGLLTYNEDKTNIDGALTQIDKAIEIAPNFNLAKRVREALENQKDQAKQQSPLPSAVTGNKPQSKQ